MSNSTIAPGKARITLAVALGCGLMFGTAFSASLSHDALGHDFDIAMILEICGIAPDTMG